jgi:hypothetical protein
LNTQECANTDHCDHTFLIIEPPPDNDPGPGDGEDGGEGDGGVADATLRALHEQLEALLSAQ